MWSFSLISIITGLRNVEWTQTDDLINNIRHFQIKHIVELRPQSIMVNDVHVSMQYVRTLNIANISRYNCEL